MTETVTVVLVIGTCATLALLVIRIFGIVRELRAGRKEVLELQALKAPAPTFLRVGGRTVALEDWSPQVLEEIKKEYFRPSLQGKRVTVLDLTATCTKGHVTSERIVIVGRDTTVVKELSDGLISTRQVTDDRPPKPPIKGVAPKGTTIVTETTRSRMEINCQECGKRSKLSGRSVVWEGAGEDWDGAL